MYPTPIRLNEATAERRRVPIWLVDATDGLTAETGITGKPNLSIRGAVPAGTTNNIVEINAGGMPGLYYIELTQAEVATPGISFLSFKTAATAQWHGTIDVIDPADTAAAVWDALTATYQDAGSFGAFLQNLDLGGVWDALLSAHITPGSFGEVVQNTDLSIEHLARQGTRG